MAKTPTNPKTNTPKDPPAGGGNTGGSDHGTVGISVDTKNSPPPPGKENALPPPQEIKTMEQAYSYFIEVYRNRPVEFVEDVLKAKPLAWQKDFLIAISRGQRRISVRAGHGVGKKIGRAHV